MPVIKRFEDILAWQKARELTRLVYRVTGEGAFARDYALRDQIRRAAISVQSNIAEGYAREGDREFRYLLGVAKGSVAEVQSQLYVALDAELIQRETFDEAYELAAEVGRLVGGFIGYLSQSAPQVRQAK